MSWLPTDPTPLAFTKSDAMPDPASKVVTVRSRPAMACAFEARTLGVDVEALEAASEAALDEVCRIESLLSWFDPASEIYRLNHTPVGVPIQVDVELMRILEDCWSWYVLTQGVFDPVAAGALRLDSNLKEVPRLPDALGLDADQRQVWWKMSVAAVDLGGYGKGYALDRAYEALRVYGVTDALLNGGGSSFLGWGNGSNDKPWQVVFEDLSSEKSEPVESGIMKEKHWALPLDGQLSGLSFSGTLPSMPDLLVRSGKSSINSNNSPTYCAVASTSALEAEVLSTTLLAMGLDGARDWLTHEVDCLEADPLVWWGNRSEGWVDLFHAKTQRREEI